MLTKPPVPYDSAGLLRDYEPSDSLRWIFSALGLAGQGPAEEAHGAAKDLAKELAMWLVLHWVASVHLWKVKKQDGCMSWGNLWGIVIMDVWIFSHQYFPTSRQFGNWMLPSCSNCLLTAEYVKLATLHPNIGYNKLWMKRGGGVQQEKRNEC